MGRKELEKVSGKTMTGVVLSYGHYRLRCKRCRKSFEYTTNDKNILFKKLNSPHKDCMPKQSSYLAKTKKQEQVLELIEQHNHKVGIVSEKLGVSKQTVYKCLERMRINKEQSKKKTQPKKKPKPNPKPKTKKRKMDNRKVVVRYVK